MFRCPNCVMKGNAERTLGRKVIANAMTLFCLRKQNLHSGIFTCIYSLANHSY